MKVPSLRQPGDLNEELNRIRAKMNRDIREKCYRIMAEKKAKYAKNCRRRI